jgi:hypothetical protein
MVSAVRHNTLLNIRQLAIDRSYIKLLLQQVKQFLPALSPVIVTHRTISTDPILQIPHPAAQLLQLCHGFGVACY